MPAGRGATTTHCQSHFGLLQQGALPQPAEEPFLPFHSISDHTLAHFSPKNVFVQILVRNGDFFVWENDQKKPPPTHSTHTAIISPRLNMAAAAGQPCFSGQGLPAVRGLPLNKICQLLRFIRRRKSTGHTRSQKSTGC